MKSVFAVMLTVFVSGAAAQEESYSYYCCFQDSPSLDGAFADGCYFGGPFRANGPVRLISSSPGRDNDPWFYSFTLSSDYYIYGWGSGAQSTTPHIGDLWIEPYELMEQGSPWFNLGVDPLPFGFDQVEWQVVRASALLNGLYLTSTEVPDNSRILLEGDQLTIKTGVYSDPVVYSLTDLDEPVVWIENCSNDKILLKGHPDSQGFSEELTIGTMGNILFSGPLEYNGDLPGILGLISVCGDGLIADKPYSDWDPPFDIETDEDVVYSASILLLEGDFAAENYTQPYPKVDFTLYGGIQMQREGYTCSSASGFNLCLEYDERLFNQSPPCYPQYQMSGVEISGSSPFLLEFTASCNPFSSLVTLSVSEPGIISIFDNTGRMVDRRDTKCKWVWNGSSLSSGVYLAVAIGENGARSFIHLVRL